MEELGDRLMGVMAGYLLYAGLLPTGPQAIAVIENLGGKIEVDESTSVGRVSLVRVMVDRITDNELGLLKGLPEIQSLSLWDAAITDEGMVKMVALSLSAE